jgi:hypothetical protein
MRFLYQNLFDLATLSPSSELTLNPAEYTQNQILGKVWRTETGFVIRSDFNNKMGFKATSTGSVILASVASATYTGSGLATVLQNAIRSGTVFDITCKFNSGDNKFRFKTGATATSLSLNFPTYATASVATIIGFDRNTDYAGEVGYTSTVSLGNQTWLQATIGVGTSTHFVIDNFNMASGTVLTLRLADATSTFSGLYGGNMSASVTVSLSGTRTVYTLPSEFSGQGVQIYWYDPLNAYSTVGRIFMGSAFYPADHPDNKIHWKRHRLKRRSGKTEAVSGATYFDKRDSLNQYTLTPDPMNEYYNPATKIEMETMLETVSDYQSLYVILDSDLSNTVYGFFPSDIVYNRLRNTPTIIIPLLLLQEQK